ncbi:MAG TPA: molecular chaperone TorD family protein [Candidatus Eisenbacteria bacterium]|nr:molecular chaperone TorD family protein [Candidatus Eisenbacteria bacterium]
MNTGDSTMVPDHSDIDLAYCRAALYGALAVGFQAPTDDGVARLLSPESRASLICAAQTLYPSARPDLVSMIEALARADAEAIPALHRELFGHTARGPVPPYETEYGNEALFQQPQELGDIMGFYRAFGLTLKDGARERPDHISCQLEFSMFLALKEAYALEQDDREMLALVRQAEKSFLADHLGRFVPTFAARLTRQDPSGFYGALADLCLRFVAAECERLEVSIGSANLGLRPADDSRVPIACGNGAGCAPMPGACAPEEAESV